MAQVAVQATETLKPAVRKHFVFLRNTKSIVGLAIFGFFLVVGLIGPWIAPYSPDKVSTAASEPPSAIHWLGTTQTGQDIFSQLLVGTRGVMVVSISTGIIATFIAAAIGVTSGFLGGMWDEMLSMFTNIFLVIPGLPLIIIIMGMMKEAGVGAIVLIISLTGWAWGARVLRSQTMSLRSRDFVEASRANGETRFRTIFFEILPNLTAILASTFIGTVTASIMSLVTLSYIGVIPPSDWSWGTVLYWAQNSGAFTQGLWWWYAPAGLCVALVGMSLALINFGIDEFVNPRLRNTGMNAAELKKRKIYPRIGFTPVVQKAASKSRLKTVHSSVSNSRLVASERNNDGK
ncbi:MAG: ABC transporter permease [Bifidobacterium aquikefiri]|uniref:Peptide ABC transporter permease n=1 Tax=Bifidobacterium aquikefiri TaxID=1653207 RepID=A0A261GAE9_9BIFI|nr:ABC transporter permease [Bifidobacterium aquikefiri]OZG68390.1 peptide ABC transporter permease [Bifidobacterium aquikefiri]